jgi:hypothetical protein
MSKSNQEFLILIALITKFTTPPEKHLRFVSKFDGLNCWKNKTVSTNCMAECCVLTICSLELQEAKAALQFSKAGFSRSVICHLG